MLATNDIKFIRYTHQIACMCVCIAIQAKADSACFRIVLMSPIAKATHMSDCPGSHITCWDNLVLTKDLMLPESIIILALELGIFFLPLSPLDPIDLLPGLIFHTVAENDMVSL